jgi:hypothetical protein
MKERTLQQVVSMDFFAFKTSESGVVVAAEVST